MRYLVLLALVVSALPVGAPALADPKPAHTTVLFAAAQLSLVADALQSIQMQHRVGYNETNPLLGKKPSDGAVLAYFGSIAALETAAYLWGPWWLSDGASCVTLYFEVPQLLRNRQLGFRVLLVF